MSSINGQRLFDLVVAVILMILLAPLFIVVMVWIKLDSPGPVFFLQERVGQFGNKFMICKFRTMVHDAEINGSKLTIGQDPRITRCGHLLRKYKIDELPQLINVLKGEMSIVGPRPEVPLYVQSYTPDQMQILDYRPGLTSPASISFSDESSILAQQSDPENFYKRELLPLKIKRDLTYAMKANFLTDCSVILQTVCKLVKSG